MSSYEVDDILECIQVGGRREEGRGTREGACEQDLSDEKFG